MLQHGYIVLWLSAIEFARRPAISTDLTLCIFLHNVKLLHNAKKASRDCLISQAAHFIISFRYYRDSILNYQE